MNARLNRKKALGGSPLVVPSSSIGTGVEKKEGRVRSCHLHNLRKPAPENDLVKLSPYPSQKGRASFETLAFAKKEDKHRAKWLRKHAGGRGKVAKRTYLALADRIEAEEATLASFVFFRRVRRQVVGELLRNVRLLPAGSWATVTLLPVSWTVPRSELLKTRPDRFLGRLRTWLNKAGAGGADGCLVAFLDAEYDAQNDVFRFHVHALATGDHLRLLRNLDVADLEHVAGQRPPIKVRNVKHREAALSYLMKSYCSGKVRPDGSRGRHRRIAEPQHSRFLRWQDQLVLSDLTLLMGCRVTGQGLKIDHPPACTKHHPSYSKFVEGKAKVASEGGIDASDGPVGGDSDGGGLEHRPLPTTVDGAGSSKATGRRGDGATVGRDAHPDLTTSISAVLQDQDGGLWVEVSRGSEAILIHRASWDDCHRLGGRLEEIGCFLTPAWKRRATAEIEALVAAGLSHSANIAAIAGWLAGSFVMPDGTVYSPPGHQPPRLGFTARVSEDGRAAVNTGPWRRTIGVLLKGQTLPRFCLAAAFVGPLLELVGSQTNTGFELVGEGGGFKGHLLKLSASVWGPAADKNWKTTSNALEDSMEECRDCFAAFDEAATFTDGSPAAAGERIRHAVFTLAEGKLKARMGRAPVRGRIRLAWASASNESLGRSLSKVGASTAKAAQSRLITLRADGALGAFDHLPSGLKDVSALAVALGQAGTQANGRPARRFVDRLVLARSEDEAGLKRRVGERVAHFLELSGGSSAIGMDHRVRFYFGLVYASGRLAKDYGCLPKGWNMAAICLAAFDRMATTIEPPTGPALQPLQELLSSLSSVQPESLQTRRFMSDQELDSAPAIKFSQSGRTELLIRTTRGRSDFPNWTAVVDEAVRKSVLVTTAGGERQVKRHVRLNPRQKSGDRFYAFDAAKLALAL